MTDKDTYPDSIKKRPERNVSGGFGKYCCIPGCKSAAYDKNREKTSIGLFQIPSSQPDRSNWLSVLKNVRRKGGSDNFDPEKKTTFICEFHFKLDDIRITLGVGRKKVIPGRVPSIFSNKELETKPKRKSPKKRIIENLIETSSESIIESDSSDDELDYGEDPYFVPDVEQSETELLKSENSDLKKQLEDLKHENGLITSQNIGYKSVLYNYENISKNKNHFRSETGIEVESFETLFEFLNPGEDCCNIKLHDTSKRISEQKFTEQEAPGLKKGPKPKLSSKEQLFLYLTWLRNGFTLGHTGWLFNIPKATVSRYLITWSNFCYFSLGSVPIWPTTEQVKQTMPESFKRTYPSTKCIVDCTELYCQRPSSLATQSSLFSHYKSHVTYKGFVGCSPSGAITFVSQLFDGSISDKEIVRQSGFLEESLWEPGDSVMADRGFTIEQELAALNVSLNIPAFLKGRSQLTVAEIKESQTIASVRIHIERAIQRVKKFRILRNEIPLTLHGSVNQIWTVCCLLCNFMPPLIRQE